MTPLDIIESILKRGAEGGIDVLSPPERKVWLISEAEVHCDMEGIDSFLNHYSALLPEAADAFAEVGAVQIAESLRAIYIHLPDHPDKLLDHAEALITARSGYDDNAVARFIILATKSQTPET